MNQYIKRVYILLTAWVIGTALAYSSNATANYYLSGIVRDAETLEPLPYASITVGEQANGALSNSKGVFELTVSDKDTYIVVSCMGYERRIVPISKKQINIYDVMLEPASTELKEVVVRKQKYSKKNNPAVEFARRLKENAQQTEPKRNPYYNYKRHELMTVGLNDFVSKSENNLLFKQFPFLWEHVDTSEISGKPILNIMVKEKLSDVHYRKEPKSELEVINALRQQGLDEITDQENVIKVLEDMIPEINLFGNDVYVLQNKFVSPLSTIAADFYKFYLTDTVEVDNEKCIVLSFYPHNTSAFGFNGQVFVPVNDSTMFIKKVVMRAPRDINLNFIESMLISQEFERAPDGSRLKTKDDLTIEARIMPGTPGIYVRRNIAYEGHNFVREEDSTLYDRMEHRVFSDDAEIRTNFYWDQNRILQLTENEKNMGDMMQKLRDVPLFYWTEKVVKILFAGYIQTGKNSKFDYGPVNTTVSFNSLEGTRFRLGGMTTANLNKHMFARGYLAYGIKDKKFKYGIDLEYSFNEKKYHPREFPVHSLRLRSSYDIDNIGQRYLYTNQDNIILSIKRMSGINTSTYQLSNSLSYTLELQNNFSFSASVNSVRQDATPHVQFIDGYGNSYGHFTQNTMDVQLRFAPGEKFYQTKTHRVKFNHDAPTITLKHTVGPRGLGGSMFTVNRTDITFSKRFWLSAFGYLDTDIKGGHVWSVCPFPNLIIPNANLTYTIQKGSFALLNPMEFINDSYAAWDVTYWLNGAILNNIPLIKKLKLREVTTFKGFIGKLSDKNDPSKNPDVFRWPQGVNVSRMTGTPYMEITAGLDNIFSVLRVDYVWRLSYLDVPYHIDRHGIRVSMHIKF